MGWDVIFVVGFERLLVVVVVMFKQKVVILLFYLKDIRRIVNIILLEPKGSPINLFHFLIFTMYKVP